MSHLQRLLERLLRRVRQVFSPGDFNRDMTDEMRFHLEMEAEELARGGLASTASVSEAHRRFGHAADVQEAARDAWPLRRAVSIARDVRHAARSLRRTPTFTIAAIVALALGIGANAAIFGLIDTIAFRPLAAWEPDRLTAVYWQQGGTRNAFSYPAFTDLRQSRDAFADLAASTEGPVSAGAPGAASAVWAMHTSGNYFDVLGVQPFIGRMYRDDELYQPVVVLGHSYWRTKFSGDTGVIGRTILVNGLQVTIIGVAPAQFTGTKLFAFVPSVWLPAGLHARTIPASASLLDNRGAMRFTVLGRLRDGVSRESAHTAITVALGDFAQRFPEHFRGATAELISNETLINPDFVSPPQIRAIGVLTLAAVTLVLFIACANVANLLLARFVSRQREIAVRLALGASRSRLVQQFLVESLVLAVGGAIAAIPVAVAAMTLLAQMPPKMAYATDLRPAADVRVFVYAACATVLATFAFGLIPALQSSRRELMTGLRDMGYVRRSGSRLRNAIVVGQVALSTIVLVAGSLFSRSLQSAREIDRGFNVDNAAVITLDPEMSPEYDAAATRDMYGRVERSLAALPGVTIVSRAANIPLDGNYSTRRIFAVGQSMLEEDAPIADFNVVAPEYFRALGTPIIEGRGFLATDSSSVDDLVVINELTARQFWPGASAIGKRIRIGAPGSPDARVIGVARVSKYEFLSESPMPAIWRSLDRSPRSRTTVLVRTTRDVSALLPEMQQAIRSIDATMPLIGLASLRSHVAIAYSPIESAAQGAIGFATLSALLALSGILGVVAYGVSQRQREIGVRMALGSTRLGVITNELTRSTRVTLIGVLIGVAVVVLVPASLDDMLYGVSHRDPLLLMVTVAGFVAAASIAAVLPAWRAARLDPMRVLRQD